MDDPREENKDSVYLTEDSEDELADLEKEFAIKKQKLMEERARKREREAERESRRQVEVERSPSPPRKRPATQNQTNVEDDKAREAAEEVQIKKSFARVQPVKKPAFAERLYDLKTKPAENINYKERIFEFEDLPPMKTEAVSEDVKDEVSGLALCQRFYPRQLVKDLLGPMKVLSIKKLLAKVTPPRYEEPAYDNWCFIGMVVFKGQPKKSVNQNQFLQLKVGDFVHSVDVFLFGKAFKKFWKLRVGEVVCILNPRVKKMSSGFNLNLSDDLHNILEIGQSRDLAFCEATTTMGARCKNHVDRSQTTLCAFHEEARYRAGGRMELQGSVKSRGPVDRNGKGPNMYMSRRPESGSKGFSVGNSTNNRMFSAYTGADQLDQVYSGGEAFNHKQYDRPMVRKSGAARKASENHKQKLEARLLAQVAPRRMEELTKLGIIEHKSSQEGTGDKSQHGGPDAIGRKAFSSKFVKNMGFDPIVSSMNDGSRAARSESLDELRDLSRGKAVSLQPCEKDIVTKKAKFRRNLQAYSSHPHVPHNKTQLPALKSHKRREPPMIAHSDSEHDEHVHQSSSKCSTTKPDEHHHNTDKQANKGATMPKQTEPNDTDNDDNDDLEISFANDSEKSFYEKATQSQSST